MIDRALTFGYLRIDGPDDARLDGLRGEVSRFCEHAGLRLVNVFHDYEPDQSDAGWLGFAQLLNALRQRPHSALVTPSVTHLGLTEVNRHVAITCITVAGAALWIVREPPQPLAGAVGLRTRRLSRAQDARTKP